LVSVFVLALFSKDIEEQWPESIKEIIIATLLRYYEEFIYIMEQHPQLSYTRIIPAMLLSTLSTQGLRLAKDFPRNV
jgi:hypothetical protein